MKKDQVQIGGTYVAKVSGQLARVRIDAESPYGGWSATNVVTHRRVRIKSAQRLRRAVASEKTTQPIAAATAVVEDDLPPQDIDERIAAAPPSIVPYEQRRARAEAAQAESADDDGPRFDPSRCATPRCRGTPVMTYLERPLCQACWERHCEEEQSSEVSENAGDARRPTEEPEPLEQENEMSKKKSTKKQSKAQPTAAKAKATTENKPKRVSALDAAAEVLAKAGKPMRAQELIAAIADQGLWTSPGGKTPHATLYAAMMREERDKGGESRFRKVDRGQFEFAGKGK